MSFTYAFETKTPPAQAWAAVVRVADWWSREVAGETAVVGTEFTYHYQDVHRCRFRVTEAQSPRRLVWHVVENEFNFTADRHEWVGTDVEFDLVPTATGTRVEFTHRGLVPAYECFAVCRDAWSTYLGTSLKNLMETGRGEPNPLEAVVSRAAALSAEDFSITQKFAAPPAVVMAAVENPRGWWSASVKGSAQALDDQFEFRYQDIHQSVHKVTERVANRWAVWSTTEGRLSFTKNPAEWVGTALVFEARPVNGGTELVFTHAGLRRSLECYKDCAEGWTYFLGTSLKELVETGTGRPEV